MVRMFSLNTNENSVPSQLIFAVPQEYYIIT